MTTAAFRVRNSQRGQGAAQPLRSFLAGPYAISIRMALAFGHLLAAYHICFGNLGLLANQRTRKYLLRLPLLHLYKPGTYPFRLTPLR